MFRVVYTPYPYTECWRRPIVSTVVVATVVWQRRYQAGSLLTKLLIIFFIRPDALGNWSYYSIASMNGWSQYAKNNTPLGLTLNDCSRGFSLRECKTRARKEPWNDYNNKLSSMEGKSALLTWWNALSTFQNLKRGASFGILQGRVQGLVTAHSHCHWGKTSYMVTSGCAPAEPYCRNRLNLLSSFQKSQTFGRWDLTHVDNDPPKRK